jgi:hypothetical protein
MLADSAASWPATSRAQIRMGKMIEQTVIE